MRIFLITGHQYPAGKAATNRIRSYLEVLVQLGHDVNVLIYRSSEISENIQNKFRGKLNGVHYSTSANSVIKKKNPILARITWIYSYINALKILKDENKKKHIDIIIQGSSKSSIIPFVYLISRVMGTKYILENSEYPWFILKKKVSNFLYKPLYLYIYYRLFDGFFLMTQSLIEYHKKYCKNTATMLHMPMTVDYDRFNINIEKENLITYVGNKSFFKDGVDILIKSFANVSPEYPKWKLMIVGETTKDDYIKDYFSELNLSEKLILTGNVHRDEIPALVCKSKILALSRPNNKQAEGGFPTKLGEYLASGNLVIATSVGEIPNYLKDNVNALLAFPNDIDSFSNRLRDGMQNYAELSEVRKKGRILAKEVFNARTQGKRLSEFLMSFFNHKELI